MKKIEYPFNIVEAVYTTPMPDMLIGAQNIKEGERLLGLLCERYRLDMKAEANPWCGVWVDSEQYPFNIKDDGLRTLKATGIAFCLWTDDEKLIKGKHQGTEKYYYVWGITETGKDEDGDDFCIDTRGYLMSEIAEHFGISCGAATLHEKTNRICSLSSTKSRDEFVSLLLQNSEGMALED